MGKSLGIILLFLLLGCKKEVTKNDLTLLNGYWEIVKVTFPDGNEKEYKVNTSVDFITLQGSEGYRKKVQPKLDGTFETSDDAEPFEIVETANGFAFKYANSLSKWQEEIFELSDNTFSIKNEEGLVYKYRRYEPINISK